MKATLIAALLSVSSLVACVDSTGISSDDSSAEPRLATNGMTPQSIVPTGIYAAPLTSAALNQNSLISTAGGRSYLQYLTDCALSSTQSVKGTSGFTTYTFTGNIGIAPAWTTRALTAVEGNWISACVLSRANQTGTNVQISMRGSIPLWGTTADEAANYNVEEGAFYGNVWSGNAAQYHACNGADQVRVGDTYGDLPLRQCAQPDPNNPGYTPCGFVFDGNCSDVCVRSASGDYFTSCNGNTYVVTTRLYGTAP
ncbi:MAG: hypothetical protein JO257_29510 [Deltaproteobacteria bacterium]|nr:hypothetical protein [Deltaproteobacteria bacterium]